MTSINCAKVCQEDRYLSGYNAFYGLKAGVMKKKKKKVLHSVKCHVSDVACQVSGVTCQVSCVTYFFFFFFLLLFSDKVVGLVGGGSVIN